MTIDEYDSKQINIMFAFVQYVQEYCRAFLAVAI